MSKLNELFVDSINKALTNAELVNDKYQKSMAYATTAHALAVYLNGKTGSTEILPKTEETVEPIQMSTVKAEVQSATTNVEEQPAISQETQNEALRLSERNKEVIQAIDNAIKNTDNAAGKDEWTLQFDENGIPFLNEEDHAYADRVMAYTNAMTPELEAKKRELEVAAGQTVLQETNPVNQDLQDKAIMVEKQEIETNMRKLDEYKVSFGYAQDPTQLNNLYHNFTSGVCSNLDDITPEVLDAFLLFIKEELAKAYAKVEEWKNSWIGVEGLNSLLAAAYQTEGATMETHLHDGNVFWFCEHIELYNANAWLNSYKSQTDKITLNKWVKDAFDNENLTVDNIDDTNVVAFIYYVQSLTAQSA